MNITSANLFVRESFAQPNTAVSTKVVQKSVKAYATMPEGSLGNTQ